MRSNGVARRLSGLALLKNSADTMLKMLVSVGETLVMADAERLSSAKKVLVTQVGWGKFSQRARY